MSTHRPPQPRQGVTPALAAVANPAVNLNQFSLDDLAVFKHTKSFAQGDSTDMRTFYVGRDDVHGILKYLLSRCSRQLKFNMFGYDDDELDGIIGHLVQDDPVFVQGTLDKSQSGGVHEKAILAAWTDAMRASFAVGQSASHQISHTKGGVLDMLVAWEGSTNWSSSGEGTIVAPDGSDTGRKAQNNTLVVFTNSVEIAEFSAELDEEHATALAQMGGVTASTVKNAASLGPV